MLILRYSTQMFKKEREDAVIVSSIIDSFTNFLWFPYASAPVFVFQLMSTFNVTDNLDATEIPDTANLQRVATLLGVTKIALVDALTQRTIFAHGETVSRTQVVL